MRRVLPLAAAAWLCACASLPLSRRARSEAARRALAAGLTAEVADSDDAEAQRQWALCLRRAAPDSREARDCRIYAGMFGSSRPDAAQDSPAARRAFADGLEAWRAGANRRARLTWDACLALSAPGTLARDLCLAAHDLLPPQPPLLVSRGEAKAKQDYFEGAIAGQLGDGEKARRLLSACAAEADPGGATQTDCRMELTKLGGAPDAAPR